MGFMRRSGQERGEKSHTVRSRVCLHSIVRHNESTGENSIDPEVELAKNGNGMTVMRQAREGSKSQSSFGGSGV